MFRPFKEVFIIIGSGKQFLADFNTALFLIVSQQTQHEFCTDAKHLKFITHNLMAFSRIIARTLSTWSSFVDVESRPGFGPSPTNNLLCSKHWNHSQHRVQLIQSSPYAWLSKWNVCESFAKFVAKFHTHVVVTLALIRRKPCALAHLNGCSSPTNGQSETWLMAVCCLNLPLHALSSCSALPVPFGTLFQKFGFFLNAPRMWKICGYCVYLLALFLPLLITGNYRCRY